MLTYIKRKINKTITENTSTLVQRIDHINESIVKSLISSPLLGEGVGGFEIVSNNDFTEHYLFTPSFLRLNVGEETLYDFNYLKDDIKNLNCYNITLAKPSFLPLYTEESLSLIQSISLLKLPKTDVHMQLLFIRRNDTWQQDLINQYEQFLIGNDNPAPSKTGRKLQSKLIKAIDKMSGFDSKRTPIDEIEQKILDIGYRFELRLVVSTRNKEKYEIELNDILKEMNFFNELELQPIHKAERKLFIDDFVNRRLSRYSQDTTLSEAELMCMLSDKGVVIEKPDIQLVKENKATPKPTSRLIDLLPIGEKLEREIDNEIVSKLPVALKKAKAIKTPHIEILDIELGATVQRITFKIPDDIVYSDIKNKHEDIRATLGSEINIIQGNEPNTITFLIPCSQRDIIYLKELLSDPEFMKFAEDNPLPFICGVDMYNKPVYKCLTKAPHLLIAGGTNSGKSVYMNAMLITFILLRNSQELRLFLIDPKKVELSQFKGLPHVEDVILNMNLAYKTLHGLVNEMESRYEKMSKIGVKNLVSYNKKSKIKLPYIVCAIDEYNDLKMVHPEVEELIERLGQKARGAGIHLILATQRPDKDVISGVIKTNLPSRISFKLDNTNEYRTVFGTGIPYKNLLGFGDGVVKYVGQVEEFIRFQAPVITLDSDEEENLFDKLKHVLKGEHVETLELETEEIEEPINKLKRIISMTNETRVNELRKEMGIQMTVVHALMQQLVDEGFLEKDGRSYKITANEDELGKWRSH